MNRYPGIQPFEPAQSHLFFGRQREARELYRLIVINNVVVLFGNSGTGKTSLLQAGVQPLLEDRLLHPVFFRFNNTHLPPEIQVYDRLVEGEYLNSGLEKPLSLAECIQQFSYYYAGEEYAPLLIFDQFEEIFTLYNNDQRKEFIRQLTNLINKRNSPDPDIFDQVKPLHIVISIRSDYLYYLDRLSNSIPSILRCRYELAALNETSARDAMTMPAQLSGLFESKPFIFSTEAVRHILSELSKGDMESDVQIEAFQLQMLCRRIEEKCIKESTKDNFIVSPPFYGGSKGVAGMLNDYYEEVLGAVDPTIRLNIQKFVEDGLISNKRRILLEKEYAKNEYGIYDSAFDVLSNWRLLKKEPRGGTTYYEISHDTLLQPIITMKEERKRHEDIYQMELIRKEKEAEMLIERRKRRRATLIAVMGFSLALISAIACIVAYNAWRTSETAYGVAEQERLKTQKALEQVLEKERQKNVVQAQKLIDDAQNYIDSGFNPAAIESLRQAMELDTSAKTRLRINELLRFIKK